MMDMDELFDHLNEVGLKPVYIDEDTGWLLEQIDDAQLREEIDMDSFGDKIR